MKNYAVLLAGGAGERMKGGTPKQMMPIDGSSALQRTLRLFSGHPRIDSVILVIHRSLKIEAESLIRAMELPRIAAVIEGGDTRQESSARGLAVIENREGNVLIHDVARPLLSPELIDACLEALIESQAVVTAVPLSDTLLRVEGENDPRVSAILDRALFWRAQTPQGFHLSLIREGHRLAVEDGLNHFSDDCGLILHFHLADVTVVRGEEKNLKITFPGDLDMAEQWLRSEAGLKKD